MAAGALDVLVRFVGDASDVTKKVGEVEGTGSKIKGWAKGIGGAIAGAFAIDQVQEFISAGSELQDQMSASEVIFGNASKAVQQFAEHAAENFGMAKSEALDALNTFATFGKGAGLQGAELSGFSQQLTGLAGDLASFRGTSTEQAIEAVGAALRGESEPIRAYGVLLDEGTLKARALSMGLVQAAGDSTAIASAQLAASRAQDKYNEAVKKHGENSKEAQDAQAALQISQERLGKATEGTVPPLTQQQKVLAAQAEILAQTGDAQGDFARTSDSAANQQKKLKADLENTQAALGTALLPVVQKLLPYLQTLAEFIAKNAAVIVPLVAIIGTLAVAYQIASVAATLFGTSMLVAMGWVLLIIAAIAALIAIGVLIVKNWDTIKEAASAVWQFMQTAWDAILHAIQVVWDWIKTNWPLLLAILTGPIGLAVLAIVKSWDTIKNAATTVKDWIVNAFQTVLDFFRDMPGHIADALAGLARIITAPYRTAFNAIAHLWNSTVGKLSFTVPGWVPGIGGKGFDVPDIPELDTGGYIMQTGLAVVHRGETVLPVGAGTTVNLNVSVAAGADPAQTGRTIVDYIRRYERANGTDWRTP